ncbi:hypothetical protein IVA95_16235 [Bradyrhizobium sp. 157]|uniref:hypothetical protein n=1 Tax=Bradyrhizobium sp. 157 TaxID=2782631 RepID=UPI001FF89F27|nr:hypothetical protein [Bradyrhizobium sp. 157]MCK1639110.1 hypothetical protein [Bradyrhizobium sp. 157]
MDDMIEKETKYVKIVTESDGTKFVENYFVGPNGQKGDTWSRYPVIDTVKDCELTETGWRGTLNDGTILDCRQDDHTIKLPPHKRRPDFVHYVKDGKSVGAMIFTWKKQRRQTATSA